MRLLAVLSNRGPALVEEEFVPAGEEPPAFRKQAQPPPSGAGVEDVNLLSYVAQH